MENAEGEDEIKCMKCGRSAYQGMTSEAIELGFGLLVIRDIPCYKCEECDEIMYTGDVLQRLEAMTDEAKHLMQDIRVVYYDKAA